MRKLIVGAQVSMDGVMQAPGGPTEDPTRGFKFGGWAMPYFDQAFGEETVLLRDIADVTRLRQEDGRNLVTRQQRIKREG